LTSLGAAFPTAGPLPDRPAVAALPARELAGSGALAPADRLAVSPARGLLPPPRIARANALLLAGPGALWSQPPLLLRFPPPYARTIKASVDSGLDRMYGQTRAREISRDVFSVQLKKWRRSGGDSEDGRRRRAEESRQWEKSNMLHPFSHSRPVSNGTFLKVDRIFLLGYTTLICVGSITDLMDEQPKVRPMIIQGTLRIITVRRND